MTATQQKFIGTWRSYKVFCYSGKVEHHNTSEFIEFSVTENGTLTMFHSEKKRHGDFLKPEEWRIEPMKRSVCLMFGKRPAYEVITIERQDLVLYNHVKGDKIFFAKMPDWHSRIEPAIHSVRHIKPNFEEKTSS